MTGIRLSFPVNSHYVLTVDGIVVQLVEIGNPDYPWRADVRVTSRGASVELREMRR